MVFQSFLFIFRLLTSTFFSFDLRDDPELVIFQFYAYRQGLVLWYREMHNFSSSRFNLFFAQAISKAPGSMLFLYLFGDLNTLLLSSFHTCYFIPSCDSIEDNRTRPHAAVSHVYEHKYTHIYIYIYIAGFVQKEKLESTETL